MLTAPVRIPTVGLPDDARLVGSGTDPDLGVGIVLRHRAPSVPGATILTLLPNDASAPRFWLEVHNANA